MPDTVFEPDYDVNVYIDLGIQDDIKGVWTRTECKVDVLRDEWKKDGEAWVEVPDRRHGDIMLVFKSFGLVPQFLEVLAIRYVDVPSSMWEGEDEQPYWMRFDIEKATGQQLRAYPDHDQVALYAVLADRTEERLSYDNVVDILRQGFDQWYIDQLRLRLASSEQENWALRTWIKEMIIRIGRACSKLGNTRHISRSPKFREIREDLEQIVADTRGRVK